MTNNIKEFNCSCCNYKTKRISDWLRHVNCNSHKKKLSYNCDKREYICDKCEYICQTKWNLRMHTLTQHETSVERQKMKYYCQDCDKVFFSSVYMNKHLSGIRHKNFVKAINEQKKLNEKKMNKK